MIIQLHVNSHVIEICQQTNITDGGWTKEEAIKLFPHIRNTSLKIVS